ncbi:glycerophosphodiester phosphodiesterase family protein [Spirosoma flavum]|uniref:Glycerophosphodiester phosphodiesterase family protein n=1 Tax=Spirosoma flavum TaxID=2048557 RepID=A0ABW6AR75_9BACT
MHSFLSKRIGLLGWFFIVLVSGSVLGQTIGGPGNPSNPPSGYDAHSPNPKLDDGIGVGDMLTLNYAALFKPDADLTGGIKATIGSGGSIIISVYTYDATKSDGKGALIYQASSSITSTNSFVEQTINRTINLRPGTAEEWNVTVKSNNVKSLAQTAAIYLPATCNSFPKYTWLQSLSNPAVSLPNPSDCNQYVTPVQPVIIESSVRNAQLISFKVPGLGELMGTNPLLQTQNLAKLKYIFSHPREYDYTFVAAHRGYWAEHNVPENTIEAFKQSIALGADLIETDIRMTKDSILAAMHDDCIERLTTGPKGKFMKDITWAELKSAFVKDRFGAVTTFKVNSLEEILDAFGQTQLISLDIKDGGSLSDAAFVKCLQMAKQKGVLRNLILKGFKTKNTLMNLISQAGVTLKDFYYTPVLYADDASWPPTPDDTDVSGGTSGGDSSGSFGDGSSGGTSSGGSSAGTPKGPTSKIATWKADYYPLIKSGDIKAVETHFKVNSDPLLSSGVVAWLQNNGARVGAYSFVADTCQGVIVMENGNCTPGVRDYTFDINYNGTTNPGPLVDGRGNLDWLMRVGGPDYIIYDRPDVLLRYLEAMGRRSTDPKVITRVALPDTYQSTDQLSATQKADNPGITEQRLLQNFDGIALKVSDVQKVSFFTPDTRNVPVNRDIINRGRLLNYTKVDESATGAIKNPEPYNNYLPPAPPAPCASCAQIYGGMTATDNKGKPYSARMKFPFYNLAEWSVKYPGYDIYLDANFWDTRGWTGEATAGPPTPFLEQRSEFMLPCTDTYGLWVSNGVKLSDTVEVTDPTSRMGAGAFDTFIIYNDNTVEVVPIAKIRQGYLNLTTLKRASDGKAITNAVAGYDIIESGTALKTAGAGDKFNNDQLEKSRMIIGVKGNELYLVTVQYPELRVGEAAQLMKEYFGCTDALFMDSGRSAAMITSTGTFPNLTTAVSPGIKAGSTPRGLDDSHLNRLYPSNNGVNVYRNLASFLAIKKK